MIVRLCSLLCLVAHLGSEAALTVQNNAYRGLVISFAPEVKPEDGKEIVDNLKNLLEDASDVLHTAIGLRIADVTFHLPSAWDTSLWENVTVNPASNPMVGEEEILVEDVADNAFGNYPLALQYGGCGVPGHKITIPTTFLNGIEGYPKGKLLAREWLKYRYGVFDENGFIGDEMYPSFYQIPGTVDVKITECTDPEVEYVFKNRSGDECSLEIPFASSDCHIHPKESSLNVTSSLMYFHQELTAVESVCGKNHTHKEFTPSKQNLLCNGKSIWEVLDMSDDFKKEETTVAPEADEDLRIQFSYMQESKPRVVITFQNSESLHGQKEMFLFAMRRFIYDLPDGSDFGLYNFQSDITPIRPFSELPSNEERNAAIKTMMDVSMFVDEDKDICVTCAVSHAVGALAEKSEIQGSVILIADSTSFDADKNLVNIMKELESQKLNLCLTIVAFTDTSLKNRPDVFNDLESLSNCIFLRVVHKEEKVSHLTFEEFHKVLHNAVPHSPTTSQTTTVLSGTMSPEISLVIPMDPTSDKYTLWTSRPLISDYILCKAGDKKVAITAGVQGTDIALYSFHTAEEDVNCKLDRPKLDPVFTHVEKTTKPGEYFKGEVWIHDPSEQNGVQMPVIIFARINFGNYPIQDAIVMADITGPKGDLLDTLVLFDNGRGDPDITQNDGIYSRYFVKFGDEGIYHVTITAENGDSTRIGKNGADGCCGSRVKGASVEVQPFKGSIETLFIVKGKKLDGGYKPSRITDLRVDFYNPMSSITLKWTAPGGEADNGNSSRYEFHLFCKSEDCNENGQLPPWIKFNNSIPTPNTFGQDELAVLLLSDAPNNVTLSIGLKSISRNQKYSDISNLIIVTLDSSFEPPTTKDPAEIRDKKRGQIAIRAIVGGSVFGLFILIVIASSIYCFADKVRGSRARDFKDIPKSEHINCEFPVQISISNLDSRDSSMRRVESFPVLLYTHDQIKDFKNKKGKQPPLYKNARPKPWLSLDALPSKSNKDKDSSSDDSASTMPANDSDCHLTEMKELEDNKSHTSDLHLEKVAKF